MYRSQRANIVTDQLEMDIRSEKMFMKKLLFAI